MKVWAWIKNNWHEVGIFLGAFFLGFLAAGGLKALIESKGTLLIIGGFAVVGTVVVYVLRARIWERYDNVKKTEAAK